MLKKFFISLFILFIIFFTFYFLIHQKERKSQSTDHLTHVSPHIDKHYDLIVFGNEPESISAAIAASKEGTKTLLIYKEPVLGGLFTESYLNYLDIPHDNNGTVLTHSVFNDFWKRLNQKNTLNIEAINRTFSDMIKEQPSLDVINKNFTVRFDENKNKTNSISYIKVDDKIFNADFYIDGTGDGTIVRNHAKYISGRTDIGSKEHMAVTLVLPVKNVDISLLKKEADDKNFFSGAEYTDTAIWGFEGIEETYKEHHKNTNVRKMNIGIDGDAIYINALQVYNVNPLSKEEIDKAYQIAISESEFFLNWMKEHFPSFQNAYYDQMPSKLYIRESVHYQTLNKLTIQDIWESRIPEDVVAMGGYPVDIQQTSKFASNHIIVNPNYYGIGYSSAILKDISNTFIVGKTAGYDSLAFGSARVVPTGMALAEAVGASIHLLDPRKSIIDNYNNGSFIKPLQSLLIGNGGLLYDKPSENIPYANTTRYSELMYLLREGLLWSDYDNNLELDKIVSGEEFTDYLDYVFSKYQESVFDYTNYSIKNKNKLTFEDIQSITDKYGDIYEEYNYNLHSPITKEIMLILAYKISKTHI